MLGECQLTCVDSILVGKKPMVALSLVELPGSDRHLALAMGGLDNKIHIYSGERSGKVSIICDQLNSAHLLIVPPIKHSFVFFLLFFFFICSLLMPVS